MSFNLFNLKYYWLLVSFVLLVVAIGGSLRLPANGDELSGQRGVAGSRYAFLFFPLLGLGIVISPLIISLLWLIFWSDYSGLIVLRGFYAVFLVLVAFMFLYFRLDEEQ